MRELLPLLFSLTLIAAAAGLCLAIVYAITKEPIVLAEKENKSRAVRAVLPEFANFPDEDNDWVESGDYSFFLARGEDGKLIGVAFSSSSPEGYSGDIDVMVGLIPAGAGFNVNRIEIIKHMETPGLGSKIADDDFKGQFENANKENKTLFVAKDDAGTPDKPPIDAITGATISSRAVAEAVRVGLEYFLEHKDEITNGGQK